MTTPTDSLDQSYKDLNEYVNNTEKPAHDELKAKTDKFHSDSGNPDMLILIFMMSIMQDTSIYDKQFDAKGYSNNAGGSEISVAQNKLTDLSMQMNVVSSFRNVNSDMENLYNNNGDITKIQADLTEMDKYVAPDGEKADNTIFDQGTKDSIHQAIGALQGNFNAIQAPTTGSPPGWGGDLAAFQADVSNKDDTKGAAGIAQSIGQNISNITQSTGTVNQTLQSSMEYQKNEITQWTNLLQTTLKQMNAVPNMSVQNQGK